MKIRLVVSGRHYEFAEALPAELELPEACSLDDALQSVDALLPAGARVPESCLVAVSGSHLGTRSRHRNPALSEGDELLLLAPIAGG